MKTIMTLKKKLYKIKWTVLKPYQQKYYFKKLQKTKRNAEVVRIGFVVQMPELWDYEVDVYNELNSRSNCEAVLIVVPPYDMRSGKIQSDYDGNFFVNHYPNAIKAINEDGSIVDLKSLKLDYIFYQRPYDHYLPKELWSRVTMKYTRCCYIPYGYNGSAVFDELNTNQQFFSNISFVFSESERANSLLVNRFKGTASGKYRRFEYLGYPGFDPYLNIRDNQKSQHISRILWTPRWTTNSALGCSHFMDYKDLFLSLPEQFPEIEFAFRPHPMMFGEFVRAGIMTQSEVDNYLEQLSSKGIRYEHDIKVYDSFKDTDLLITDYSSIINLFFLTGKPIICCDTEIEFSGLTEKMSKFFYYAHNEEELRDNVQVLVNGEDRYYQDRSSLIDMEFSSTERASKRIADRIIEDYME